MTQEIISEFTRLSIGNHMEQREAPLPSVQLSTRDQPTWRSLYHLMSVYGMRGVLHSRFMDDATPAPPEVIAHRQSIDHKLLHFTNTSVYTNAHITPIFSSQRIAIDCSLMSIKIIETIIKQNPQFREVPIGLSRVVYTHGMRVLRAAEMGIVKTSFALSALRISLEALHTLAYYEPTIVQ
eukprot:jgi/Hompol1/840/HPOL_004381-RA